MLRKEDVCVRKMGEDEEDSLARMEKKGKNCTKFVKPKNMNGRKFMVCGLVHFMSKILHSSRILC